MTDKISAALAFIALWFIAGCGVFRTPPDYRAEIIRDRKSADASMDRVNRPLTEDSKMIHDSRRHATLGIDEAVLLASKNNKEILAALEGKEIAAGQIEEAYSIALPSVTLTGSYMSLDRQPAVIMGGATIPAGMKINRSIDATLRQPIWRGGAAGAAVEAANLYALINDEVYRAKAQDIIFATRKAYDDNLLLTHLTEVSEAGLASAQAQCKQVERRREEGMASDFALLRAQVGESNQQAQLIQNRNNLKLAQTRLRNLLGLDELPPLSDQLIFEPMIPVFDQAVKIAAANNPELMQAEEIGRAHV